MSKVINAKVGEEKFSKFNGKMVIIEVKDDENITVQFTDGKVVNTTYQRYLDDDVRVSVHEVLEQVKNYQTKTLKSVVANEAINDEISSYDVFHSKRGLKNWRVGEVFQANNGQQMKIVAYNGASKITVKFEDGTIVNGRKYCHIQNGEVKNPTLGTRRIITNTVTITHP